MWQRPKNIGIHYNLFQYNCKRMLNYLSQNIYFYHLTASFLFYITNQNMLRGHIVLSVRNIDSILFEGQQTDSPYASMCLNRTGVITDVTSTDVFRDHVVHCGCHLPSPTYNTCAVWGLLLTSHSTRVTDTGHVTSEIFLGRHQMEEQGTKPNVCYMKWSCDHWSLVHCVFCVIGLLTH